MQVPATLSLLVGLRTQNPFWLCGLRFNASVWLPFLFNVGVVPFSSSFPAENPEGGQALPSPGLLG